MGYSHSWYRDKIIDPAVYDSISADFATVVRSLPDSSQIIEVPDFWGAPGDIAFGGKTGTCESMVFCRISQARTISSDRATEPWQIGKYFEYCKTEMLPYDSAVTCLLSIAKHHMGDAVRIFSDGKIERWQSAFEACKKYLGYRDVFSIREREICISLS